MSEEQICTDGLLPDLVQHWLPPSGVDKTSRTELIKAALIRVADTYANNEIVWPAQIDGDLQQPPRSHVVDWVVREYVLVEHPNVVALRESGFFKVDGQDYPYLTCE